VSSKCNCIEWAGLGTRLKDDFDADFRRLGQADLNRMELSRVGDKAVVHGDLVGMTATNDVYTSSYHSLKGSYQELLLQKEKAKKRASAGGSVAGGDAAASRLVFEYCDLLFKVFREQWSCFKEQRKEVLLSVESRTSTGADAESETDKSDEAKRNTRLPRPKPKKVDAKKYYAVAVGRKTGVFTTWDEAERSVSKYSGCVFKSFKHKAEAKTWLWEKRRQQPRRRRRAHSSDDSSGSDSRRRGSGRRGSRDRRRSTNGRRRRSSGGDGGDSDNSDSDSDSDSSSGSSTTPPSF
jgi:hypothetical protein